MKIVSQCKEGERKDTLHSQDRPGDTEDSVSSQIPPPVPPPRPPHPHRATLSGKTLIQTDNTYTEQEARFRRIQNDLMPLQLFVPPETPKILQNVLAFIKLHTIPTCLIKFPRSFVGIIEENFGRNTPPTLLRQVNFFIPRGTRSKAVFGRVRRPTSCASICGLVRMQRAGGLVCGGLDFF
ncbi:hypothetical protein J6590_102397 [Homalodisca vitripennis]|nr:hypothetical protein J6590_033292 [Homalodisca vitripennis]KAG8308745.1 hypothetical protein J6590_102397 [Homalodisca vitripennis]